MHNLGDPAAHYAWIPLDSVNILNPRCRRGCAPLHLKPDARVNLLNRRVRHPAGGAVRRAVRWTSLRLHILRAVLRLILRVMFCSLLQAGLCGEFHEAQGCGFDSTKPPGIEGDDLQT